MSNPTGPTDYSEARIAYRKFLRETAIKVLKRARNQALSAHNIRAIFSRVNEALDFPEETEIKRIMDLVHENIVVIVGENPEEMNLKCRISVEAPGM